MGVPSTALSRRALLAAGLGFAAAAAFPRRASGTGLFGRTELRLAHSGSVLAWQAMLGRHSDQEKNDFVSCPERLRFLAASCGARRWSEILAGPFPKDAFELLRAVNARINGESRMADNAVWGTEEYWATPREFLALGGDCEDFAIAKFMLLLWLGWPEPALRLAVVQEGRSDRLHAVIAARLGDEAFILDNLDADLRRDGDCSHYRPLYAVSETGLFLYRE